mgnify:CR=1 FL=1
MLFIYYNLLLYSNQRHKQSRETIRGVNKWRKDLFFYYTGFLFPYP